MPERPAPSAHPGMTVGRIYPSQGRRFSPWKNGGGETAEILCHPLGAGFEDFDWRISTARVAQSGPFSIFPGIGRVLTVIEGGEMSLSLADGQNRRMGPGSAPFAFPGDIPCDAELHGTPLLDLNLMARHPLRPEVLTAGQSIAPGPVTAAWLFALRALPGLGLDAHDLLELAPETAEVIPEGALLILIRPPAEKP